MKCKCHPDSPFHWAKNKRPSIFLSTFNTKRSMLSMNQTAVVEREREAGRDIAHIAGLSKSDRAQKITDFKRFAIFSLARPSK